jgi:hypothetical protein
VSKLAFQFHLQTGKQKKEGWMGEDSHVVLVKNSLVNKEV